MTKRTSSGSLMAIFQIGIRDIPSPLRIGPFAKNTAAKTAISGAVRPNVEVAMFILLAVIIPVVALFGIKWLVFRPTHLTIHPAGGAFMRVPRGRRCYVLFGPRLPHDPSRNCGSRPRRQRTVVVIRDLKTGLDAGAAHSHARAATPRSACSCAHDHRHGHDSSSEHYVSTPDERELNIKRARTAARGGTAFGPVATADPRTGAIHAPRFVPDDVSSANASTISADGGISVRVRKASESLEKDSTNSAAAAGAEATQATPGSPKEGTTRPGPAGFATASADVAAVEDSSCNPCSVRTINAPSAASTAANMIATEANNVAFEANSATSVDFSCSADFADKGVFVPGHLSIPDPAAAAANVEARRR